MIKYFFFFLAVIFFTSCSSDNAVADNVDNTLDDLYVNQNVDTSIKCATAKQTNVTSVTDAPMLVVLLNYKNIQTTSSIDTWAQKIFSKDAGSLNDYFGEISNTQQSVMEWLLFILIKIIQISI